MDAIKEELQILPDEQQHYHRAGSQDQPKRIDNTERSSRSLSSWLLLFGSFLLVFNTWGLLNSFGTYQEYYTTAFLSHKSSSAISWIGTTQAFLLEIVGIAIGPIFDRGYLYTLIYIGSFLIVFGMIMLSLCSTYWQVILAQGLCVGIGSGLVFVPSIAVVTATFEKKRAIAVGVAASASSLGGVIYPIIFRELQPRIGFPWATRVIAFLALGIFFLSFPTLSCYKVASNPPRSLIDYHAFGELPFVLYLLALFVLYAGYFVPLFYIPTYASASLELTSDTAFYMLAVTNAGAFFGRLLPGLCPKPFATVEALLLASSAAGISVLAWMRVNDVPGFVVFCVIFGALSGIIITLTTILVPVLSPETLNGKVGTRLGMAYAACGLGVLIGSPIAGAVSHTQAGDFRGAQAWGGTTLLLGSLLLIYPWWIVKKREK